MYAVPSGPAACYHYKVPFMNLFKRFIFRHDADVPAEYKRVADEVFVTGTAAELTPVREIDNRKIGNGKPGLITMALQKTFFSIVRGEDPSHASWLTRI